MSKEELAEKALEDNDVELSITIYEPFHKFAKEYLAFFGSPQTVEQFCMGLIYDRLDFLYQELRSFVSNHDKHIDPQAWFEKWPHIATTSYPEPEDRKESDCQS